MNFILYKKGRKLSLKGEHSSPWLSECQSPKVQCLLSITFSLGDLILACGWKYHPCDVDILFFISILDFSFKLQVNADTGCVLGMSPHASESSLSGVLKRKHLSFGFWPPW